jgi:hypothetical protein
VAVAGSGGAVVIVGLLAQAFSSIAALMAIKVRNMKESCGASREAV